jgi:TRAP-type C4-dicarboxylate transport system permease small subunit
MNRLATLYDRLLNLVLFLLMAAMVVVISAQVWYRFILNDPLSWSEELGRYMFVWISFIGAAVGIRFRVHLGIDLLEKMVPAQTYRYLAVFVNLIIQVFLALVVYQGFDILNVVKFQTSASMGISMTYPYAAVPVGALLMLINSLRLSWIILNEPVKETEAV